MEVGIWPYLRKETASVSKDAERRELSHAYYRIIYKSKDMETT